MQSPNQNATSIRNTTASQPARAPSKAAELANLAIRYAYLFHDADGIAYARISVNHQSEVYPVDSPEFRHWLDSLCFARMQTGFSQSTMNATVATLCARARHVGPMHTVHLI